jgi:hypothetical protein
VHSEHHRNKEAHGLCPPKEVAGCKQSKVPAIHFIVKVYVASNLCIVGRPSKSLVVKAICIRCPLLGELLE